MVAIAAYRSQTTNGSNCVDDILVNPEKKIDELLGYVCVMYIQCKRIEESEKATHNQTSGSGTEHLQSEPIILHLDCRTRRTRKEEPMNKSNAEVVCVKSTQARLACRARKQVPYHKIQSRRDSKLGDPTC